VHQNNEGSKRHQCSTENFCKNAENFAHRNHLHRLQKNPNEKPNLKNTLQGLKASSFWCVYGTTKVVPWSFYISQAAAAAVSA